MVAYGAKRCIDRYWEVMGVFRLTHEQPSHNPYHVVRTILHTVAFVRSLNTNAHLLVHTVLILGHLATLTLKLSIARRPLSLVVDKRNTVPLRVKFAARNSKNF